MQTNFLSIVVVSLNPGEKLKQTLQSIAAQTFSDYEVIIKDGGSTDGALEEAQSSNFWEKLNRVNVIVKKDKSIYDGMNQAVKEATGKYVQFLNCGDIFANSRVLSETADFIRDYEKQLGGTKVTCDKFQNQTENAGKSGSQIKNAGKPGSQAENADKLGSQAEIADKPVATPHIFYGNQYNRLQKCVVTSSPKMDDFACFRNVPCHQVCFYDRRLFAKRAYKTEYTVRGDYEHFLYSIYEEHAVAVPMPIVICDYEGGGYSETRENRKRSAMQHREITNHYLGKKAMRYRLIMFLSLAGLRTKLAESKHFSGIYNQLKSLVYGFIHKLRKD